MNKLKFTYEQPSSETLVVRLEGAILGVSGGANWNDTPGGAGGDDNYGENDGEGF